MTTTSSVAPIRAVDRAAAEKIGLSSGATSILLNRLETAGHIERRRGHADRRVATLHASADMRAASSDFFAPLQSRIEDALQRLDRDEVRFVQRVVAEIASTTAKYATEASA